MQRFFRCKSGSSKAEYALLSSFAATLLLATIQNHFIANEGAHIEQISTINPTVGGIAIKPIPFAEENPTKEVALHSDPEIQLINITRTGLAFHSKKGTPNTLIDQFNIVWKSKDGGQTYRNDKGLVVVEDAMFTTKAYYVGGKYYLLPIDNTEDHYFDQYGALWVYRKPDTMDLGIKHIFQRVV